MANKIFGLISNKNKEGPIEAGQTHGLTLEIILKKYFKAPNAIIALLRTYNRTSSKKLAEYLDITEQELLKIEQSKTLVPFQLVPKLAKFFNVDLKILLSILGHTKVSTLKQRTTEFKDLPIAAQYAGEDLTEQEKIDFQDLIKMIIEKTKAKKNL